MMKRLLYAMVLCVSIPISGKSQGMLDESFRRVYYCAVHDNIRHAHHREDYVNMGSYEKNGKTYQCLRFERSYFDNGLGFGDPFYEEYKGRFVFEIGIRESEGRWLVDREEYLSLLDEASPWSTVGDKDYLPYAETDDGELVLYDFNMHPGDKFRSVDGYDDIVVDSVNMITTRDGSRRLLYLSNGCQVLDGVGCLNSTGSFLFYLNPKNIVLPYFEYDYFLYSCTRYDYTRDIMLLDVYNCEDEFDTAQAEDYYSLLLKEGKQWNYEVARMDGSGATSTYSERLEGDTVVNGMKYFKLYRIQGESRSCTALLREVWRKVYVLQEGKTEESKLYDFGTNGGPVTVNYGSVVVASGKGEVKVMDVTRRSVMLRPVASPSMSITWVEGVGCLEYGLLAPEGCFPSDGTSVRLVSCYDGDECIYDANKPLLTVRQYELETTTGLSGQTCEASRDRQHALFDLQGRRLSAVPQRGMYIRDGRKYVVK